MRRSVRSIPATAARIRSIQRGPRRGGGMILVVSDITERAARCVPMVYCPGTTVTLSFASAPLPIPSFGVTVTLTLSCGRALRGSARSN